MGCLTSSPQVADTADDDQPTATEYDFLFKVLVIGDTGVGKTSVISRFVDTSYPDEHVPTVEIEFKKKNFLLKNHKIELQIWDTGKPSSETSSYYRGAHGILILFDLTNEESFNHIVSDWLSGIERYACENVQKLLIANKCDEDGSRKISAEKLKAFANDHHLNVLETSAKNSINIEEIFTNLSEMMLKEANE
eukprot:TRINITY_DN3262_c0_g1_i16.p1 TRINITY_DN3262_c0_g1~~TRINITY_DN3262_c0_g1_i16.p1  ORF type:complete len:193 (+),score=34.38 TRINITY_DN3262_c0_g1_i16:166-744(+)